MTIRPSIFILWIALSLALSGEVLYQATTIETQAHTIRKEQLGSSHRTGRNAAADRRLQWDPKHQSHSLTSGDGRGRYDLNIVVKMKFGSHLYGTSTPLSDTDYKAVYIPEARDIILQPQFRDTIHIGAQVRG